MVEMVKAKLNGEYEITLPKHRADRPEWYTETGWERKRLRSMHENLGPGDIIYYVGGEEGEMVALCQIWGAKTVIFEPNPKVWSHYPLLWEHNNLEKPLATIPGFASDKNNKLSRIYRDAFPPEADSVIDAAHGFKELHNEGNRYGQVTIDSCVYDHGLPAPTAITLDVEGSEWSVLHGAERVLKEHKPKIWLSGHPEFMIMYWKQYLYDLRNWIIDIGYTETILDYKHEVHLYYEPK